LTLTEYCGHISERIRTMSLAEKQLALGALDVVVTWHPEHDLVMDATVPLDGGVASPSSSSASPPRHWSYRARFSQPAPRAGNTAG